MKIVDTFHFVADYPMNTEGYWKVSSNQMLIGYYNGKLGKVIDKTLKENPSIVISMTI